MQNTARTTIRLREDLLHQSRMLALKKGVSLQDVINDTLALGFKHVTSLHTAKESMKQIDAFRQNMQNKHINIDKLLEESKNQQR